MLCRALDATVRRSARLFALMCAQRPHSPVLVLWGLPTGTKRLTEHVSEWARERRDLRRALEGAKAWRTVLAADERGLENALVAVSGDDDDHDALLAVGMLARCPGAWCAPGREGEGQTLRPARRNQLRQIAVEDRIALGVRELRQEDEIASFLAVEHHEVREIPVRIFDVGEQDLAHAFGDLLEKRSWRAKAPVEPDSPSRSPLKASSSSERASPALIARWRRRKRSRSLRAASLRTRRAVPDTASAVGERVA